MNIYKDSVNSSVNFDKMIIACLRDASACEQAIVNMRLPQFNWHRFLKRAFAEGVDGLLFDSLSKWNLQQKFPAWALEEIKQNYMRNLGRNLLITTHLENVLQCFEENKIEVLILRGADFLNRLYPRLGSRNMSDVDLVIHKENHKKVISLLEKLEYKHPKGYSYLFSNNALFIDLHIDYLGSYKLAQSPQSPNIKNKEIWQNSRSFKNNSIFVKVLSEYDSIITCCAHLQEHSFSRIIWFYDIRNMIISSEDDFDWDKLIIKAREYDLEKSVFYVLKYMHANQILSVPLYIMKNFELIKLNSFEKKSLSMLLGNRRKDVSGELMYLFSKKGFIRKIKCFWQSVFIDKESFHLSVEKITFWHYLKRFIDISSYGIKKIFKLISI